MKIRAIIFFHVFIFLHYLKDTETLSETSIARQGKFFGVGLVRFENGICTTADGLMGTCYTRRQCADVGGVRSADCANGIGVCCIVQVSCGNTSSSNNTYFVSPSYPNAYTGGGTCILTIQRCNSDICQIRIDFLTFSLAQPNDNGTCVTDAFYVVGGAGPVPVICGENSGQHIYVDFNGDNDIQLIFNTNGADSTARAWNLKISQLACDCPTRAPVGCLMYYTALSGNVKSFNYGTTGSQTGSRQLANENYGVCVEMAPGYCSIQWSQSSGDPYSFTVTNDTYAAIGDGTIGTAAAAASGVNCTTDFVVIPNPIYTNGTPAGTDRFCGNGFIPVTTSSKPFVLTVVTNGNEVNDTGNRGFCLQYTQQQCTGTMLGLI